MIDVVLVTRASRGRAGAPALPPAQDPLWAAMRACGITTRDVPPPSLDELRRLGIEVRGIAMPLVDPAEIDRDSAIERARDRLALDVSALERAVESQRPRVVAFLGTALYGAVLGARAADAVDDDAFDELRPARRRDRARDTFRARVRFGGAVAVAIPLASKHVLPSSVLERVRDLARLRDELREAAET